SAEIHTMTRTDQGLVEFYAGEDNYRRLVAVDSLAAGDGVWLYGLELNRYDGPWQGIDEDLDKNNLLLKYSHPLGGGDMAVTLMAYDNAWNSADQIPARAVNSGQISKLGV